MTSIIFRDHSLNLAEHWTNSGSVVREDVPGLFNEPDVKITQQLLIGEVLERCFSNRCFSDHAVLSQNCTRIRKSHSKVVQRRKYWERAEQGEFKVDVIESNPPSKKAHQRPGAKSEVLLYIDPDQGTIAEVHQYTNPDGSLGASGKPDPKALLVGDILYIADKSIKN